jgi:GTPase SAR1 family protein
MRKAHGAIIVFDVTNAKTFRSVGYWVENLRERATFEHVQIILVGNKIDRAQYREVSVGEA